MTWPKLHSTNPLENHLSGMTIIRPGEVNLCRDSTEAGSNLLKLSVTDGFFWRSEIPLVTVIGPLSDPRPLPCKPLPFHYMPKEVGD